MRVRLPRGVASFVVCATGLLFLYVMGWRLLQLSGLLRRFSEVRPAHRRYCGRRPLAGPEHRGQRYRMVLPARLRQLEERQRAQEAAARRKARKGKPPGRPPAPRGRSRRGRPARPSATTSSRASVRSTRSSDGVVRAFLVLLYAELARSHQPQLPPVLPRRRPPDRRASLRGVPGWCARSCGQLSSWAFCYPSSARWVWLVRLPYPLLWPVERLPEPVSLRGLSWR